MQIRGQRHPTISGETMALFLPWLPGDLLIHLSEGVTSNVKTGKGKKEEGKGKKEEGKGKEGKQNQLMSRHWFTNNI